jgi:hypothetical protein
MEILTAIRVSLPYSIYQPCKCYEGNQNKQQTKACINRPSALIHYALLTNIQTNFLTQDVLSCTWARILPTALFAPTHTNKVKELKNINFLISPGHYFAKYSFWFAFGAASQKHKK